jgi:hypothetical protein
VGLPVSHRVSRAPWYLGSLLKAGHTFRLRDFLGSRPAVRPAVFLGRFRPEPFGPGRFLGFRSLPFGRVQSPDRNSTEILRLRWFPDRGLIVALLLRWSNVVPLPKGPVATGWLKKVGSACASRFFFRHPFHRFRDFGSCELPSFLLWRVLGLIPHRGYEGASPPRFSRLIPEERELFIIPRLYPIK